MSDLNKIINEQRERIAELEQSQVPNGYIAVPADAWHELCQQEQRAEEAVSRCGLYVYWIKEAIEAIEREDDSSLYDAVTFLEHGLQLRQQLNGGE